MLQYMKDQPSTCHFKSLSIHSTEIQTLSFDQNYLRKFAILGFTNDKWEMPKITQAPLLSRKCVISPVGFVVIEWYSWNKMAEWVSDEIVKVASRFGRKAGGYQRASGRNDSNSNRINKSFIITSKHKGLRSIYDSSLIKFQHGTVMEISTCSDLQMLVFLLCCCCQSKCFDGTGFKCDTFWCDRRLIWDWIRIERVLKLSTIWRYPGE